jgi:hypothetical protein
MVAITATNSAVTTLQSMLSKSRVEQAQRDADLAEARARDLRAQANAEDQKAQQNQQKVRTLSEENNALATTYAAAIKANTSEVPAQTQDFLVRLYKATSQKFADSGNALKSDANAAPVLNAQGQATGRIVNVST